MGSDYLVASKLDQTCLLWATYLCAGMADSVRGPTLLELRDLVRADISSTASIVTLKSVGGLGGTLVTGLLLDRCRPSTQVSASVG